MAEKTLKDAVALGLKKHCDQTLIATNTPFKTLTDFIYIEIKDYLAHEFLRFELTHQLWREVFDLRELYNVIVNNGEKK